MASSQHQGHQHGHHGPQQAPPVSLDMFTEINRKHWDQAASTYYSAQWQKDLFNRTHAFIMSNINWIGVDFLDPSTAFEKDESIARQVRVLDYACGPGTFTSMLQGFATEIVGVDLSENMVKTYNDRFAGFDQHDGTLSRTPKAFVGNLLDDRGPSESIQGPEFFDFDLVVVGYAFHHFADLHVAASRLVSRLKSGGVLLIVDFLTHEKMDEENPARDTVAHHGFGKEEVEVIFKRAGLVDVGTLEMEGVIEPKKHGAGEDMPRGKRKGFLGRGKKPA